MRKTFEASVASIAGQQYGVVTRSQLLQAGVTVGQIDAAVQAERLRPLYRGVYVANATLSDAGRLLAAVLACGSGAVLSHRTAAAQWKLIPAPSKPASIDVTIGGRRRVVRPGIRLRRAHRLRLDEVTVKDGIPITTPARTVLDLSAVLGFRELEQAFATMEELAIFKPTELVRLLERYPRHRGASRVRALLESESKPALTKSKAEEWFLALMDRAKLSRPALNVWVEGYRVDALFRKQKVIVEVDGFAFHSSRKMFESDRSRGSDLESRGYRFLRFTANQVRDEPEVVLVRLVRTLARAESEKR